LSRVGLTNPWTWLILPIVSRAWVLVTNDSKSSCILLGCVHRIFASLGVCLGI
jgi:hypothetical protein